MGWISDGIYEELEHGKDKKDPRIISISGLGKCVRQLVYRRLGPDADPIDGRGRLTLGIGTVLHDHIRRILRRWLQGRGGKLQGFPKEIQTNVQIGGQNVGGHIDGKLLKDGRAYLLEVKTMNDRSFQQWRTYGKLDQAYETQIKAYQEGTGLHEAVVLGINKNDSDLYDRTITFESGKATWEGRKRWLGEHLWKASPEEAPREYAPNEKGQLPWQCAACGWWRQCWEKHEPVQVGRWKIELKKP